MRKIVLLLMICIFAAGARGEGIRFFKGSFQEALKQAKAGVCRFLYHVVRTLSTDVQKCIPG